MSNIDTATLLAEIQKLSNKIENKKIETKGKRTEGTYHINKNGAARLQYMLDGRRYSNTVEVNSKEDAEAKLALFIDSIKKELLSIQIIQ